MAAVGRNNSRRKRGAGRALRRTEDWMVMAVVRATALLTVLAGALLTALLTGAVADTAVRVYSGDADAVTLASWGAGKIEVDEEEAYLQAAALRVETKGFFEGGRLDLKTPIEGGPFLTKPENAYVALAVMVPEPEAPPAVQPGMPAFPGAEFGAPAPDVGMAPVDPGMAPPVEPGVVPAGGEIIIPDQPGPVQPAAPEKITRLRVLVITDKGEMDSGPIMLADYPELIEDWRSIVLPLSAFGTATDLTGAKILGVALFGDAEEEFYVGDVALGQEDQPLVADAGARMTVKVNTEVTFKAAAQPGGGNANYVWDFDELDGLQEQGYGPEATWTFLTPGYYMVTLLVSDPAGRKVTRMDRLAVKVE